jgi:hypothetical protein
MMLRTVVLLAIVYVARRKTNFLILGYILPMNIMHYDRNLPSDNVNRG